MPTSLSTDAARVLGIDHPIVQGPFGGGLSTPHLAALVSNRGGLGSFGAESLTPEGIADTINEIRGRTNKPFNVNLWVSKHDPGGANPSPRDLEDYWTLFQPYYQELGLEKPDFAERTEITFEAQAEALLAEAPPVFSFVYGIPSGAVLQECRRLGIVTLGTATSVAEAEALDAAGVDAIVATGFEAAGHRVSFLGKSEDQLIGTFALIQLVRPRVKAPVVAAGGIADGIGARGALALGAGAVQVGTAFLACEESGTSDAHRAALFTPAAHETALTRGYTGRLARGIRNRWIDDMALRSDRLAPFPVQGWFFSKLKAAALEAGRTDIFSLYGGQITPNLRHRRADDVFDDLRAGIG